MTAATIRQRARKGKSERKGGNGSSEGRTRTEERANGRGREGGRTERRRRLGAPGKVVWAKAAAVGDGDRGRLPSFVDDWMDSHSSANVNKAIDGTDRTTPLYKHSTKSRRHSGLCGFVSSRSPTSNCISISETSACFITRPRAR